jgi:hypothetical protein
MLPSSGAIKPVKNEIIAKLLLPSWDNNKPFWGRKNVALENRADFYAPWYKLCGGEADSHCVFLILVSASSKGHP